MTIESCDTQIKGTTLSVKEADTLMRKLEKEKVRLEAKLAEEMAIKDLKNGQALNKDKKNALTRMLEENPDELIKMKNDLFNTIKAQVEDGLDAKVRQVSDLVKVQDLVDKFTKDPISGETIKSASDVIKTRLNSLVGRNSADTRLRVLRNHFRNKIDEFEAMFKTSENAQFKSIRDIKKGTDEERILYKKVYEFEEQLDVENLTPEKVKALLAGKGEVDRLALSMVAYNEYSRKAMGQFGVAVKYNRNYVMKRNYDWAAMEKMGRDQWAVYMVDHLNIKQTFGESTTRDQALHSLGFGREEGGVWHDFEAKATDRTSHLSNKDVMGDKANSKAVKFMYKDSDAAYEAARDLSVGGMREQFERNAMSMAGTAIQISEFGYDSRFVMNKVNEKINKTYAGKRNALDQWRESRIVAAQEELTGQQNLVQGSITNFSNNVRFMTAFTKLGTTIATTIADAVENNRQAFYVNGDFFGGIMDWSAGVTKQMVGMSKEERLDFASTFGIILSHQSNAEAMRMATGDLATNGGALTRLIQEHGGKALNIATLLPSQTGYSKIASAMTGANNFAKLIDSASRGKMNKFQLDTMKEYGFNESDLSALKMVEKTDTWGRPIYTGRGIRALLDHKGGPEAIGKLFGVQPETAGKAVLELATKYESFINDFVTRGTPTPELATKTLLFKGVKNEYLRALINLTTQFMDTPLSQAENVANLADKLRRINTVDGKLQKANITGDVLGHMAVYGTAGTSMYLAADFVMSAATNSESMLQQVYNGDADKRRQVFTKALSRTGLIPYAAELIDNQWGGGYNKTAMDTFIGPNAGTLRDVLRLTQADEDGGLEIGEFLRRQGPSNAIPVRGLNNWADAVTGSKIWDDKKGTFL